jgi:lipopolysaccharide biosynthesis regulator YciM
MVALSFLRSVQALQDKRQEEVSLRIPVLEKLGACYMELDQVEQAEPILARAAELKKQSSS